MKVLHVATVADSYAAVVNHFQWNRTEITKAETGKEIWRLSPMTIVIDNPCQSDKWIHAKSPVGPMYYEEYIDEIVKGKHSGKFDYDYHSRLFNHSVNTDLGLVESMIPDKDTCQAHVKVLLKHLSGRSSNQIEYIIKKLKQFPTSRRALAITWEPVIDAKVTDHEVPCLQYIQCMINQGRLDMIVMFRSEDMLLGYPVNVVGLVNLMMYIANQIGVKCGTYTHIVTIPHIYVSDVDTLNRWK